MTQFTSEDKIFQKHVRSFRGADCDTDNILNDFWYPHETSKANTNVSK